MIGERAARHDAAFVLECARSNGAIVSARKGVTDYVIRVIGRAAHAGVEPSRGRSAVLEAAHKAIAISALMGRWPGVTCNVGVLRGGTRPNVVPEEAVLEVDLRSPELATLEEAEREVAQVARRTHSRTTPWSCDAMAGTGRWKTAASQGLVVGGQVAGELRFEVGGVATGGASDRNTTSAAGCPTLDRLGPIGGGAHAVDEWLDRPASCPYRAAGEIVTRL